MIFQRYPVDYALVGDRDGSAGRAPDPSLWRREAYRQGYAQGLLARAERIARASMMPPLTVQAIPEARL